MKRRRKNARGAVLVEYAFLLTAVGIPVMMGITLAGYAMMKEYQEARTHFLKPFP